MGGREPEIRLGTVRRVVPAGMQLDAAMNLRPASNFTLIGTATEGELRLQAQVAGLSSRVKELQRVVDETVDWFVANFGEEPSGAS
jgi:hypothetical protein